MTAKQSLRLYDEQAAALGMIDGAVEQVTAVIERMEQALAGVVARMEELAAGSQKAADATSQIKTPFDTIVKDASGGLKQGLDKASNFFTPQGLALSFGINLVWNLFGEDIMTLLSPMMNVLEAFAGFVHGVVAEVMPILTLLTFPLGLLTALLGFLAKNMDVVLPLILGVGAALLLFKAAAVGAALAAGAKAAAVAVATAAVTAWKWATEGLNAAMLANPLFWVILLIIGLVSVIFAAVAAYNKLTGSAVSAAGVIGAVFAVLGAFLANTFLIPLWNMGAAVANFFGNVFRDPVAAVQALFLDMALAVLGHIRGLATGIETLLNKIPGVQVDLTGNIDALYDGLAAASQKIKDESGWVEYVKGMDNLDLGAAADAGYQFGASVADKVSGLMGGAQWKDAPLTAETPAIPEVDSVGSVGEVGAINGDVSIADEDLQLMKDAAEMRYVQNFVTLTPTVSMNASISERVDKDAVVASIARVLEDEVAAYAEGVYA